MIYADTDFVLALAKKEDWLKRGAENVYKQHRGGIITNIATAIEIALVCKKRGLDPEATMDALFQLTNVEGMTIEEGMQTVHFIKDENVGVFDAFHAVLSRGLPIASSEKVYDRIGKERIRLEGE